MGTTTDTRYTINGLVPTNNSVMQNLEQMCNACGTWLTYDTHEGKWAVVINRAGSSMHSFSDSNIIGSINVACTPLDKLYNTVKVTFPHEDLKNQTDFVQIAIPSGDRQANEFDNVLNISYPIVTNPVQAQLLGFIELKQSRVDKVVTFRTDFSKINVKAGDLIDITNSIYGWSAKVFRVITVSEADGDDGNIVINITALEYDASVYDESNLNRYVRTDSNGIVPLGSLPTPTKPVITSTMFGTAPSYSLTTTITGGLADGIEFWSSNNTDLTDSARAYSLLKTVTPTTLGITGNVIPLNANITTTVESLTSANVVVKARSFNSDGVSEFSLPSDISNQVPVLVPGAITDETKVKNNDGSGISGMMTASAILKLLNTFMGGSSAISMKDVIKALSTDPAEVEATQLPAGYMISATSGQTNFPSIAVSSGTGLTDIGGINFTAPYTGNYIGNFICDQNTSGARGTDTDEVAVGAYIFDHADDTLIGHETSGGRGTWYWNDWAMSVKLSLIRGHTYDLRFYAFNKTDIGGTADITYNWNIYTVKS